MAHRDPFRNTPDVAAYVARPVTETVLTDVRDAVCSGDRMVALRGSPGIGKTFLLHVLADRCQEELTIVRVPVPSLPPEGLFGWVLATMGVSAGKDPRERLVAEARKAASDGQPLLIAIDDAESLPEATATALGELHREIAPALRLLLILDDARDPVLSPLGSELTTVLLDEPMSSAETAVYVYARLAHAGFSGREIVRFDPAAIKQLHEDSEGLPARVNDLADALLRPAESAHAQELAGELRPESLAFALLSDAENDERMSDLSDAELVRVVTSRGPSNASADSSSPPAKPPLDLGTPYAPPAAPLSSRSPNSALLSTPALTPSGPREAPRTAGFASFLQTLSPIGLSDDAFSRPVSAVESMVTARLEADESDAACNELPETVEPQEAMAELAQSGEDAADVSSALDPLETGADDATGDEASADAASAEDAREPTTETATEPESEPDATIEAGTSASAPPNPIAEQILDALRYPPAPSEATPQLDVEPAALAAATPASDSVEETAAPETSAEPVAAPPAAPAAPSVPDTFGSFDDTHAAAPQARFEPRGFGAPRAEFKTPTHPFGEQASVAPDEDTVLLPNPPPPASMRRDSASLDAAPLRELPGGRSRATAPSSERPEGALPALSRGDLATGTPSLRSLGVFDGVKGSNEYSHHAGITSSEPMTGLAGEIAREAESRRGLRTEIVALAAGIALLAAGSLVYWAATPPTIVRPPTIRAPEVAFVPSQTAEAVKSAAQTAVRSAATARTSKVAQSELAAKAEPTARAGLSFWPPLEDSAPATTQSAAKRASADSAATPAPQPAASTEAIAKPVPAPMSTPVQEPAPASQPVRVAQATPAIESAAAQLDALVALAVSAEAAATAAAAEQATRSEPVATQKPSVTALAGLRPPAAIAVPILNARVLPVTLLARPGLLIEIDGVVRGEAPLFGLLLTEGTHRAVAAEPDGTRNEFLFEVNSQNLEVRFDAPASR